MGEEIIMCTHLSTLHTSNEAQVHSQNMAKIHVLTPLQSFLLMHTQLFHHKQLSGSIWKIFWDTCGNDCTCEWMPLYSHTWYGDLMFVQLYQNPNLTHLQSTY